MTGKERQVTINMFHHLKVLLQEAEEAHFRARLQEFLTFLKKKHPRFYTYFNTNYCSRLDQWSSSSVRYSNVNTNMFLEAFHRVLKIIYLHNKQNRRIDTLLTTLLKISRDKAFEQCRKLEIGKASHRLSEINKRHKSAEEKTTTQTHQYQQVSRCKWLVQSQRDPQLSYTVQIDTSACQCQLVCNKCSICAHMCSCSCLDAVLHSTICKHVHYIVNNSDHPHIQVPHQLQITGNTSPPFLLKVSRPKLTSNEQRRCSIPVFYSSNPSSQIAVK